MSKNLLRIILAVILGEIVLIALTTLAQEVLVNGVHFRTSSTRDLIIGGIATLLAGLISGVIARLVAGNKTIWPVIFLTLLIATETLYLITSSKTSGPLWFDVMSALALVISVWFGYLIFNNRKISLPS